MTALKRAWGEVQRTWRERRSKRGIKDGPPVGVCGESIAARHLIDAGYFILKRNARNKLGEIDLVVEAPDKRTVVFVEVKTAERPRDPRLAPELRVGQKKQRKIVRVASKYLKDHRLTDRPVRFDVIGVTLPLPGPGPAQGDGGRKAAAKPKTKPKTKPRAKPGSKPAATGGAMPGAMEGIMGLLEPARATGRPHVRHYPGAFESHW